MQQDINALKSVDSKIHIKNIKLMFLFSQRHRLFIIIKISNNEKWPNAFKFIKLINLKRRRSAKYYFFQIFVKKKIV